MKTKNAHEPLILESPNPAGTYEDFVFLDDAKRPFRIRETAGDGLWLFYWHADNKWVSARESNPVEAMRLFLRRAMDYSAARHYEAGVPFLQTQKKV